MIQVEAVTKTYRRIHHEVAALRGVSFELPAASFAFVLGPSGSGKSTLLQLLGALDEPTSGELTMAGQRLRGMTARQRSAFRREQVGFVFQSFNLLSNLTAVDNVLVPFLPGGVPTELRARAINLLKQVGLGERLDHRPSQLSGGEQQRVAIARALLKEPKLVLADEPTGELDSQTGAEVFRLLRDLRDQHQATVIVVTHDPTFIHPDDRILRLRDGRLVAE
ncbi:MAG TPA: ABC transporter ATP-binding protein [Planctomycetaceae bacterium]|nr:ABC transporter ATP-binding protein [Planctomycetaceae bacterium]